MTEMDDLMEELACAIRQRKFEAAEEVLSVIAARHGFSRSIYRGRYAATPHKPVELDEPNVVTIHDLPSRDGVIIDASNGIPRWRPAV